MPRPISPRVSRGYTSFDYVNMAQGKAVVKLYGAHVSGADLVLVDDTFWSSDITTTGTIGSGVRITGSFDLNFDRTITIEGDCIINVPFGVNNTGTAMTMFAVVTIQKTSEGTTSDLVSGVTPTFERDLTPGQFYTIEAVKVDIPKTKFEAGDTLTIKTEVYTPTGNAGDTVYLAHDPKNRGLTGDSESIPSSFTVLMPFVGDL